MTTQRPGHLALIVTLAAAVGIGAPGTAVATCGAWSRTTVADPSPQFDALQGVDVVSPTDAWAVGSYGVAGFGNHGLIEHWGGSAWVVEDNPSTATHANWLMGVAEVDPTDVWAVGFYIDSSADDHPLMQHFDGADWTDVTPPAFPNGQGGRLLSISAVPGTDEAWAVGFRHESSSAHHTVVLRYDGDTWTLSTSPDPASFENHLSSVVATSATDAWAVGYQTSTSTFVKRTLALRWNGVDWSTVGTPNVGAKANVLNGVSAAGGASYAVGSHASRTLIERWNGSAWTVEASADPGTRYDTLTDVVAVSARGAWAVGYDDSGSASKALVEHRSRTGTWSVQTAPTGGRAGTNLWGVDASSGSDVWAVGQSGVGSDERGFALYRC